MSAKDFVIKNGVIVNTNLIYATAGQVGINNATPDANLTITGTANVQGNVAIVGSLNATSNVVFGANATVANNLTVGNSTVNSVLNSTSLSIGSGSIVTVVNVGANVSLNTSALFIGNSTTNTTANSSVVNTSVINLIIGANVGANVNITTSTFQIGNSTVNTQVNSSVISTGIGNFSVGANVGANVNVTTSGLSIGNSTVNTTANSSIVNTGTLNATTGANVGANVNVTTTGLSIGNTTVNTTANSSVVNSGIINLVTGANVGANVNITTSTLQIGNSTVNTQANSSVISSGTGNFSAGANVGANVNITTSSLQIGNSTVNTQANSSVISTGTVNHSIGANVGANVLITTSGISIGNSTVNTTANSSVVNTGIINLVTAANVGANVNLSTTALSIGNTTVNSFVNSSLVSSTGNGNFNIGNFTTGANVGANVIITTGGYVIGNTSANLVANSTSILISNSSSNALINPLSFSFGNSTANNVGNSTAETIQSNSTVNTNYSATLIQAANSTSTANHNPAGFVVGTSTINTTAMSEGANVILTTSTFLIGNSTVNSQMNSSVITTKGSMGINTISPSVTLTVVANDGIQFPTGNNNQRPTGNAALVRHNSEYGSTLEIYANSAWYPMVKGYKDTIISSNPIVEDSATNLLVRSEQFSIGWNGGNVSFVGQGYNDPFDFAGATSLTGAFSGNSSVRQSVSIANDNLGYTFSAYFNTNNTTTSSKLQLTFTNSTANVLTYSASFNAQTGLVTSTSGSPRDFGSVVYNNGWARVFICANNNNSTANAVIAEIFPDLSNTQKGLTTFGAQMEKQNSVTPIPLTSYIKTLAASKSRPAGHLNLTTVPFNINTLADDGNGALNVISVLGDVSGTTANSGYLGEYFSNVLIAVSATGLSTGACTDIVTLSLPAGDWDIWGTIAYTTAASTQVTQNKAWISNTSATDPTSATLTGAYLNDNVPETGNNYVRPVGTTRQILSTTTTIYLSMKMTFTVSTANGFGFIAARRVR
jgi:hypothetical protein